MNGEQGAAEIVDLERETRSSITLKRSVKLEPYWDIKLYFESGKDDAAVDSIERLERIDRELRTRFLTDKLPY